MEQPELHLKIRRITDFGRRAHQVETRIEVGGHSLLQCPATKTGELSPLRALHAGTTDGHASTYPEMVGLWNESRALMRSASACHEQYDGSRSLRYLCVSVPSFAPPRDLLRR